MTIVEAMKRAGYDSLAQVAGEALQSNDFLSACPWFPASDGVFHKHLQAARLGVGTFGSANGPVGRISSTTDEVIEPIKIYEADSPIDERVLDTAKDPFKTRDSEDALNLAGFLQGFNSQLLLCNDTTTPNGFKGLAQRRAALSDYCKSNAGSTSGSLTSMWVFEFGPAGFNLRYSDAGSPGIVSEDRGRHYIPTQAADGYYWALIRHFSVKAAFELRDQRAMMRLANIEATGSTNNFSASIFLKNVKNRLPNMGRNAVAFANRTLKGQIDDLAYTKANASYSIMDIVNFGPVPAVASVPVLTWESILDTETTVS